jgi:hypothetical protein
MSAELSVADVHDQWGAVQQHQSGVSRDTLQMRVICTAKYRTFMHPELWGPYQPMTQDSRTPRSWVWNGCLHELLILFLVQRVADACNHRNPLFADALLSQEIQPEICCKSTGAAARWMMRIRD